MTHPEDICKTIVEAMTTDGFGFYYGSKPDQNFEADEFNYPMVFMDSPVRSKILNRQSGVRDHQIQITLFIAYKKDLDETEPNRFENIKKIAWQAAREFILRLRRFENVKEIVSENNEDADNVFDINLSGVLVDVTFLYRDAGETCTT